MTPDLAALIRERFGTVHQLAAEAHAVTREDDDALRAWRRHVLQQAMPGATRRGPRTRLHRPRLIHRHLEREERPWESREAWLADLWDGWAE